MKKIFKIFIILVLLSTNLNIISASNLTLDEVTNRINTSSDKIKSVSLALINFSESNEEVLNVFADKAFLNKIKDYDVENAINEAVKYLKDKGYQKASSELNDLKKSLTSDMNYLKETLNITKTYLKNNKNNGVVGSLDIFIAIRQLAKDNKDNMAELLKIYQNIYIDYINNKIDKSFTSLSDIYDDLYNMDIISKSISKSKEFMDIYNEYHLEDYEALFKDYFKTYYARLKKDYYKIYDKLENKMQETLDNKINNALKKSITEKNNTLYNIIDDIELKYESVAKKIENLKKDVSILTITGYISEYEEEIKKRFDEAIIYTESYLDVLLKSNDSKVLIKSGIITYSGTDLKINSFLSKLISNYSLKISNSYNNLIGTKTKLQVSNKEYIIIVKGDISASGKIDITDIVSLCNRLFNKSSLDNYQEIAADINDDGKIDITDIVLLCNKIFV